MHDAWNSKKREGNCLSGGSDGPDSGDHQECDPDLEPALAQMRRGADGLLEQIRVSRETIDHSKDLISQIEGLLARLVLKP